MKKERTRNQRWPSINDITGAIWHAVRSQTVSQSLRNFRLNNQHSKTKNKKVKRFSSQNKKSGSNLRTGSHHVIRHAWLLHVLNTCPQIWASIYVTFVCALVSSLPFWIGFPASPCIANLFFFFCLCVLHCRMFIFSFFTTSGFSFTLDFDCQSHSQNPVCSAMRKKKTDYVSTSGIFWKKPLGMLHTLISMPS